MDRGVWFDEARVAIQMAQEYREEGNYKLALSMFLGVLTEELAISDKANIMLEILYTIRKLKDVANFDLIMEDSGD